MSRSSIILVLGGLIFILLVNSIYIVNEKEKALVTQFGEVIRPDVPVGLHLKLPIIKTWKNLMLGFRVLMKSQIEF